MLVNTMEQIVDNAVKALANAESDCCTCERCIEDMKCLALNSLPPRYVSTTKGELFSKLSQYMLQQASVDVNIACLNAINFVKSRPHHDK